MSGSNPVVPVPEGASLYNLQLPGKHNIPNPSDWRAKNAAPGNGGGAYRPTGQTPSPPPAPQQLTKQQLDDLVAITKDDLTEKLKPFCSGDRLDFRFSLHQDKLEFCFPFKNEPSLIPIVQLVCDHAKKSTPPAEVSIGFLREKFMVARIKDTSGVRFAPPYRLEVMCPLEAAGNGLVMATANAWTSEDQELCVSLFKFTSGFTPDNETGELPREKVVEKLRNLGVDVMLPKTELVHSADPSQPASEVPEAEKLWASVAGYVDTKMHVKQSITLPLVRPDLLLRMAQLTRGGGAGKKTSGVLFTGPPGVGKTSMAKVAAHAAGMPLVYVPVESVVSKWYGEAEQKLRQVFEATRELGSAVLFLDELDAFAGNRDSQIHEVTRRILSVLLRQLDGLDAGDDAPKEGQEKPKPKHIVLVGATNRLCDLDAALRSRFNKIIDFPLPDESTRAAIFKSYAAHLQPAELAQLGCKSEGFSGRDIRETCDDAEQRYVSDLLTRDGFDVSLTGLKPPPYTTYLASCGARRH